MKPSVGRIVHYHPNYGPPLAAIITGINADGSVSLTVFHPHPPSSWEPQVRFSEEPQIRRWTWPPRE